VDGLPSTSHCRGVRFHHPRSWRGAPWGDEALVALEPARADGGFRANLVLTVMSNGGLSFRDWQAKTDRMLPILLRDYSLLDVERLEVAGQPGGRRCARYVSPSGCLVLTNQWFTAVGDLGITLSATADVSSFGLLQTLFAQAAANLTIPSTHIPTSDV